jgi:phosphatidate cytidylyltransferase
MAIELQSIPFTSIPMTTVHWVFATLFLSLSAASMFAFGLRALKAKGQPHATLDNLVDRINAWWLIVATLGLAFAFGRAGVIICFALLSVLALREFASLTFSKRSDHLALALCFYVALPVQYFLIWIEWYSLYTIFIPVYGFLLLPVVAALRADTERFTERVATVQWGLMLCVFSLSHVPALLSLELDGFEGRGELLILFLLIVVQSSDVFQYIWGKLFGKHKVAPTLSPSKTWEGLLGGLLTATLLGAALYQITPFSPLQAGLIALMINLMGFFGGLVLSGIKRDHGAKDWGSLIQGHGGVIDRLDSILFAAPIFFHVLRYAFRS